MITIIKDGDNIHITGHSLPDVCSAVSSVMYTSMNLLIKYAEESFDFEDNTTFDFVKIKIKSHDRFIDMIIDNMMDMFKDIEDDSPNNVKIVIYPIDTTKFN